MTRNYRAVSIAAGAIALAALTLPILSVAHHSVSGHYDQNLPVSFEGVVTRVQWANPHVWIFVDSTDDAGNVVHWEAEASNPVSLARRGWKKDSLSPGDRVSVEGIRARCCTNVVNTRNVTMADGTRVFSGEPGSEQD